MIDHILYNGNIVTLDGKIKKAEALAISSGRIVAIGDDSEILDLATASTIRENLGGRTVIPGLVDAHIHWKWTARTLQEVDLYEVPSRKIALERVAARTTDLPQGEWIIGQGWTQEAWDDRQFPTAAELDTVTPHHPAYLRAKSAHAFWVNSFALRVCGIDRDTPDPEGGYIGKDEHGNPNGMLYENAGKLITAHIPVITAEESASHMLEAQKLALASGLTGIHDYDGPDCLTALQLLRDRGQLGLRVVKNVNKEWIHHAYALGLRWGFGDDWIRIGGLKIFSDGALGPRTALMLKNYEGEPDNLGVRVTDVEEMLTLVSEASAAGLPSTIHAIGDRAMREVLDVFEAVRAEEAQRGELPTSRRHRIEHVQVIHPDDIPRMAKLNIIASMQPIHATSDYRMADRYWGDRSKWAYNARVQLDQGVTVAFGSDSPVDPFEPLRGIHAAVTRQRPDGSPGENGWYPENRLTVDEALRAYTIGAAYAAGTERYQGRLAPGYLADLVVLDQDLYKVTPADILDIQIHATMVGGVWRHGGV
ncbi:MAG TPA: amidohydrolase [Phototrophicaceae bacterium]|jgi:predicted amidohydrolase YtcJ|nr:amidohydrolase [Phototrophicaceae bacterium]